jgi:hypothetical protein
MTSPCFCVPFSNLSYLCFCRSLQCIGLPGPATSEVQVEAAKKILLVLCIDPSNIDQRTGDLHMNPGVVISAWPRHRREVLVSQSRQYVDLSKLVAAADTAAARKLAAEQDAVFEKDGNGGLVHTAINSALPFRLLLQLRRVYTAVPLAMVATTLEELADAAGVEAVVVRTVSTREATFDSGISLVHFMLAEVPPRNISQTGVEMGPSSSCGPTCKCARVSAAHCKHRGYSERICVSRAHARKH